MNLKKVVKEPDVLLDAIERRQKRYDKQLKVHHRKLKENEKVLRKRLKSAEGKGNRKKLKRELHSIEEAYALIGL